MGATDVHRDQIIDLIHGLEVYFRERADVYVSGNILMLYEEGDGNKHRSPDVLVALQVPRGERESYKIWEEGKAPDFIVEVTSRSTRTEDMGEKKGLYALLGVTEYVVFDPLRDYLTPNLRAWRLEGGEYLPVAGNSFHSTTLGIEVRIVDDRLRVFDPARGLLLPTRRESEEHARQAEERAARAQEEAARDQEDATRAQEDAARARAQAEQAEQRAAEAAAALEAEQERRVRLEAEIEALRRRREPET